MWSCHVQAPDFVSRGLLHTSESNKPVIAVFLNDTPVAVTVPASETSAVSISPSAAVASSARASRGSSSSPRSPLPRYIPVSASSPRPRTFGSSSTLTAASSNDASNSPGRDVQVLKISSPVMVLGISGSGKKEGSQPPTTSHGSPRKIHASPIESAQPHVVARVPRSAPTTAALHHTSFGAHSTATGLLDIPCMEREQHQAEKTVAERDWNIFDNPSSLRVDAAAAAALARDVLGTQAASHTVAGISNVVVKVKTKESARGQARSNPVPTRRSPGHLEATSARQIIDDPTCSIEAASELHADTPSPAVSATSISTRSNQKWQNRPVSASTTPSSEQDCAVTSRARRSPSVADLVAKFESAAVSDVQSPTRATSGKVQKQSPASCSAAPQPQPPRASRTSLGDETQRLSPRSSAVSAVSDQLQLRSAAAAAVKAGSEASVLQLYPQNAVWDHDSATILRDIHADSTVHGVTVGAGASSPKPKTSTKPPMRTPLKTPAAARVHSPVVPGSVVLLHPASALSLETNDWP